MPSGPSAPRRSSVLVSNPEKPNEIARAHLDLAIDAEAFMQFVAFMQHGRIHYRMLNRGVPTSEYTAVLRGLREHLAATEAHRAVDPDRGTGEQSESGDQSEQLNGNSTGNSTGSNRNGDSAADEPDA